jgi:hypothetical protein
MCIKCNCTVLYSCTAPLLKTSANCNLAVGEVETPVVYTMRKPIPMMLHMSLIVGIVRMRLPVVYTTRNPIPMMLHLSMTMGSVKMRPTVVYMTRNKI